MGRFPLVHAEGIFTVQIPTQEKKLNQSVRFPHLKKKKSISQPIIQMIQKIVTIITKKQVNSLKPKSAVLTSATVPQHGLIFCLEASKHCRKFKKPLSLPSGTGCFHRQSAPLLKPKSSFTFFEADFYWTFKAFFKLESFLLCIYINTVL